MENTSIWFFVAAILFVFLLIFKIKQWWKSFLQKRRFKRGNDKEHKANAWLKRQGFNVLEHNKEYGYTCYENNKEITIKIQLDYLVEKNGKRFVVEVKSGKSAPTIKNSGTRRQILEYAMAIPNDGVYLLDMEKKELKLIQFGF